MHARAAHVRDIVESKRNGARMTGVGDAESARGTEAFSAEPATLYVVATPIGNLRDVTLRALDILRSADVILAEDTRVTAKLLARYGIATRPRALHRHNEAREVERTRAEYRGGSQRRAGQRCRNARDQRSGRAARARDRCGRSSRRADARRERSRGGRFRGGPRRRIASCSSASCRAGEGAARDARDVSRRCRRHSCSTKRRTALPTRSASLAQALEGRRMLTIARELTKAFETIAPMPLADAPVWLAADANRSRGEFVLIVDAAPARSARGGDRRPRRARCSKRCSTELPPSRAARVAAKLTGLPRDLLYAHALDAEARVGLHSPERACGRMLI